MRPSVRGTLRHQMRPSTPTCTHTHMQSSVPLATLPLPLLLTPERNILNWSLTERNWIELNYTGLNCTGLKGVGLLVIICPANIGVEIARQWGSLLWSLLTATLHWPDCRRGEEWKGIILSLCAWTMESPIHGNHPSLAKQRNVLTAQIMLRWSASVYCFSSFP